MHRKKEYIDCLILAVSFFTSSLFIYIYLFTLDLNEYASFGIYSLIIAAYNMGWITFAYIFLDLVEPKRRATANGLVICVVRLMGDSISPYWVGSIADACLNANVSDEQETSMGKAVRTISGTLKCTQYSFYPLVFVSFVGGVLALSATLTFRRDRERAILKCSSGVSNGALKTNETIEEEEKKKEIRF